MKTKTDITKHTLVHATSCDVVSAHVVAALMTLD